MLKALSICAFTFLLSATSSLQGTNPTPSLKEFERLLLASASKGDVDAFIALCHDHVVASEYRRGDDYLIRGDQLNFAFVTSGKSNRYILQEMLLKPKSSSAQDKSMLKGLLKNIHDTAPHQRFLGESVAMGKVPLLAGRGMAGRAASNYEWLVLLELRNSKWKIARIAVSGHG